MWLVIKANAQRAAGIRDAVDRDAQVAAIAVSGSCAAVVRVAHSNASAAIAGTTGGASASRGSSFFARLDQALHRIPRICRIARALRGESEFHNAFRAGRRRSTTGTPHTDPFNPYLPST